jgi:hypothetical protein
MTSRCIALSTLNLGTEKGIRGRRHILAALPLGKLSGTHFTGSYLGMLAGWKGPENLASTGFPTPNCPAPYPVVVNIVKIE